MSDEEQPDIIEPSKIVERIGIDNTKETISLKTPLGLELSCSSDTLSFDKLLEYTLFMVKELNVNSNRKPIGID